MQNMHHVLKGEQISCHSHLHSSKTKRHIKHHSVSKVRTSSTLAAFLMCICGVVTADTLRVEESWLLWTAQSKIRDGHQEGAFLPSQNTALNGSPYGTQNTVGSVISTFSSGFGA